MGRAAWSGVKKNCSSRKFGSRPRSRRLLSRIKGSCSILLELRDTRRMMKKIRKHCDDWRYFQWNRSRYGDLISQHTWARSEWLGGGGTPLPKYEIVWAEWHHLSWARSGWLGVRGRGTPLPRYEIVWAEGHRLLWNERVSPDKIKGIFSTFFKQSIKRKSRWATRNFAMRNVFF